MKITLEFDNGDVLVTAPERLQLTQVPEGVALLAGGQIVAGFRDVTLTPKLPVDVEAAPESAAPPPA